MSTPFLSFIEPTFVWNIPLIALIFLRFLVFPILLFSSIFFCTDHWGRLSYLSLLFFGTLHSNGNIFPFLLCAVLERPAAAAWHWSHEHPWGDTRCPRSGAEAHEVIPHVQGQELTPVRRYLTSNFRNRGQEEIPYVQGQEQRPVRRHPTSKVRSGDCALRDWPCGDTPCPRSGVVTVLCGTDCVEIPHVQVQRNPRKMVGAGAAVRRHPTLKAIASQIYLSRLLFVLDYGPARFFFFTC